MSQYSSSMLNLLTAFREGVRVRAAMSITYVTAPAGVVDVDVLHEGVIERVSHAGALVHVRWDGRDDVLATSFDSLQIIDPNA